MVDFCRPLWWRVFIWGDYLVVCWICEHGNECHMGFNLYPDRKAVTAWP